MGRLFLILFILITLLVVIIPATINYILTPFISREEMEKPPEIPLEIYFHEQDQIMTMDLEEYLIGTVAAEMPASFELEALKAQAVAARTYALKRLELSRNRPNPKHPQAQLCTDPTHCQAWHSPQELKKRWGPVQYHSLRKKIRQAVEETAGIILTYQGQLIDPVYHSTSNGRTDNAGEIWQQDVPYLQGVPSPWDLASPKYHHEISYTASQLRHLLELGTGNENPSISLKILTRTQGGRIKEIQIGERVLTGEEFRRLLKLHSAHISWQQDNDKIIFTTKGYGHGVGMSQYGANGMAQAGKDFRAILTHYYTNVNLQTL